MARSYLGSRNRLQTLPVPTWITRMLTERKLERLEIPDAVTLETAKYYHYSDGSEAYQPGYDQRFRVEAGSVAEALADGTFFVSDVPNASGRHYQLNFGLAALGPSSNGRAAPVSPVTVSIRAYTGAGHARPRSTQSYLAGSGFQPSLKGASERRGS